MQLPATEVREDSEDLQIAFACGTVSTIRHEQSDFLTSGQTCQASDGLNTFALKLSGNAAADYSAVVRCGYIRYDNGTFVGNRVQVEARDGQWCHDLALQQIDLHDRMLLTDVSFEIEPKEQAPKLPLAVRFNTRAGWTAPTPAEHNLCAYTAFRKPGVWACNMAPPTPSCVCPCDSSWQDFFNVMTLALATR